MKIQRTSQVITIIVIVLSLIAISFAVAARHFLILSERAYEARRIMFGLLDQLAEGSDRLTNWVRAYAATGDKRYFDAFENELNVDRNRDRAVEGLQQLGLTQTEDELIKRAKQGSDQLVILEKQAFAAVENNDEPRAIQIVYGSEFTSTKATIVNSIAECRQVMEKRLTANALELASRARLLTNLALSTFLINALTILGVLLFFYRRRVINPLAHITENLTNLIAGKRAEIGYQNETSEIGEIARSIDKYRASVDLADRQHWIKTGLAEISETLQGAEQPEEFAQLLFSKLVPLLDGGYGAFHLFEEKDGRFHFVGGYGFDQRTKGSAFAPGEGIPGQAAIQQKLIVLNDLPADYIKIGSGLGEARPRVLVAAPVTIQDRVLAVIEVASFSELTTERRTLLEESAGMIALKLDLLQRNLATRELLGQVRISQERTRKTEQFFRSVLELAPDGIMVVDESGVIRLANKQAEVLFGYTRDELIGKPVENLVPDEIREHHPALRAEFHRSPKVREMGAGMELQGQRKDGSLFPIEIGLSPIPGADGELGQVAVSIRDVTERKKAEGELRKANFLSDIALELTGCGYWQVDYSDPDYYYQSERAARILGEEIKPDGRYHLQNEWFARLVEADPELAKLTAEKYQDAIDGRAKSYDAVYAYKRPIDGEIAWLHAAGQVVRGEDGKARFMYGVYQDITEFKRLEVDLRQAKANADEATLMKSMFLANMSHEIRTPMNAIIGLSYLALKTSLNAKQRDYLTKIHTAGTSLLTVINDILDFSKIEAGKLDIEEIDFRLDDVITSVTTVTAQKAQEKGLEFLAVVPASVPQFLVGDPLRLGQILINLINNAVKFTERGEIQLIAELLQRDQDQCLLKFSIRDTGVGMSSEQASKLFQPFTQADMSTTRKHGGTGLGLTICKRLVEMMGGEIGLESQPGIGSAFFFTVRLGVGEAKVSGKIVPEKLQELRVLVVDDNPAACEIIQDSLVSIVEHVDTVQSGPSALTAIQRMDRDRPYDILFVDWRMPEMDGLQVARRIKSDEKLSHQPAIILVTAFGREEVREEAEHLHLDGFLLKPVTRSMLVDALVNVFGSPIDDVAKVIESVNDVPQFPGLSVLLADDNEINQQIAVELLEGVGARVDVANNGREAVDKLFQSVDPLSYDIVFMDLQMPEMDGYQATTRIRSESRFAKLPIIAMTAHATMEERQRCLDIGMNDHVSKPIDPALLFHTIGRYYEKAHSAIPKKVTQKEEIEIPSVEGLNSQDGLSRVNGNKKLYLKLLRQFTEQGAAPDQISRALTENDWPLAERIAHTVKGVAGNLGAGVVQEVAGSLEKVIRARSDSSVVEPVMKKFGSILIDFLDRLNASLPNDSPAPVEAVEPLDVEKAGPIVEEMITHLNNFDSAAGDCLEKNAGVFRALLSESYDAFEKEISNYAFADALLTLQKAAKWKGVRTP